MKKYSYSAFLLLLLIGLAVRPARAQFITMTPNQSDFCGPVSITFTAPTAQPGTYYEWWLEDFNINWGPFGGNVMNLGQGTSISLNSSTFAPTGILRLLVMDQSTNTIISSDSRLIGCSGAANIPWQFTATYSNCGNLMVPPPLDPMGASPNRWAMWYKNGVPTGVSSYISGDLVDSAWYEYKVKLNCGDTLTTGLIYFWRPSAPVVTATGNTSICTGDTVILNVSSSIVIDAWLKNGVAIAGSSGKTSIKVTEAGQYTVNGKFDTGSGTYCYLPSAPVTITVNPGAFITSPAYQICSGDSVLLTTTAASSYVWKKNGAVISGANAQSLWVKSSGQYQVISTGLVCATSVIKEITFFTVPTLSVSPNGSISLCSGNAIPLTASGTNISKYQWYKNGSPLSGGVLSSLTPTGSGSYKCTVYNAIGCAKSSSNISISAQAASGTLPVKTIVLKPGASGMDAYVTCAFGNFSTNFGYTPTLEISNWYKYFRTAERGFLDFDLSELPPNSPIVSATLKLWVDTVNSLALNYPPNSLLIKRCIQAWNENTISWSSGTDSSDYQFTAVPCSTIQSKSYVSASVTNQLKHWSFNPAERFGFYLQLDEYKQLSWLSIASSDNSNAAHWPKLTVKYTYADINPGGPMNLCTGGSVTFSTNAGPYSRQWYKNGVAINGATALTYTATTAGDYFVMLTDAAGCAVASVIKTVTINEFPVINLTPSGTVNYCSGDTVVVYADSLPGYTFQWKKNNVNIAGATQRSYAVTQSGTFSVRVTSACGKVSKDSLVCNKIFNPAAVITPNGPTTFCTGSSVTLNANTFTGVSYQWKKDGLNFNNNLSYTITGGSGAFAVLESANGCSRLSNTIVVTVNCREGDVDISIPAVTVFPVPVSGSSSIRLDGVESYEGIYFELMDLTGKMLLKLPCEGAVTTLSGEGFADGIYLLRTLNRQQQLAINKVVFAR